MNTYFSLSLSLPQEAGVFWVVSEGVGGGVGGRLGGFQDLELSPLPPPPPLPPFPEARRDLGCEFQGPPRDVTDFATASGPSRSLPLWEEISRSCTVGSVLLALCASPSRRVVSATAPPPPAIAGGSPSPPPRADQPQGITARNARSPARALTSTRPPASGSWAAAATALCSPPASRRRF